MSEKYTEFAHLLVDELTQLDSDWIFDAAVPEIVSIENQQQQLINLNLTPFHVVVNDDLAGEYFKNVDSIDGLIDVYQQINTKFKFEFEITDLFSSVSDYANEFLKRVFINARKKMQADDVSLILNFIKDLDCYTAIKSIESLLYSHSDLELLRIANNQGWNVHFDHVAIRCGSSENGSANKVAELLINNYGYSHPGINNEDYYLFEDGWSAYPLYKMLKNGQVLRIFVDQSEATHPEQIIQHWNQVYGFTAHHLALRLTTIEYGKRRAIPLPEIIALMTNNARQVLSPAGYYTNGLLNQVFTKPEKDKKIPTEILESKKVVQEKLPDMLMNAKLLEIVSRKEMSIELAKKYFNLYDIEYNATAVLHSAVYYQYFLPSQAAHVIKSSLEI